MDNGVLERKCTKCGKIIRSLYPRQLENNFRVHQLSCEDKKGKNNG